MIRLRDKATGAEAEWDRYEWSGDEGFVRRCRTLASIEHVYGSAHDTFAVIQERMAETFPPHGVAVVRQTKPKETPHDREDVVY